MAVREPAQLTAVRLDVAGFVGCGAARSGQRADAGDQLGRLRAQVRRLEPNVSGRDRLLPYAVQAFFAQGGRRAWVVRVAPAVRDGEPSAERATARFQLGPEPGRELMAADEGAWGTALDIRLAFAVTLTLTADVRAPDRLLMPAGGEIPDGSLLRIRYGTVRRGVLRWAHVLPEPKYRFRLVGLGEPLPEPPDQREPPPESAVGRGHYRHLADHRSERTRSYRADRFARATSGSSAISAQVLTDQSLVVRTAGDWENAPAPRPAARQLVRNPATWRPRSTAIKWTTTASSTQARPTTIRLTRIRTSAST